MKKLALGLILLALVAGCGGGGSSSGGNHDPLKAICQTCTYNNECESNDCRKFSSGRFRCVPYQAPIGYACPAGQYKLNNGGISEDLSCQ